MQDLIQPDEICIHEKGFKAGMAALRLPNTYVNTRHDQDNGKAVGDPPLACQKLFHVLEQRRNGPLRFHMPGNMMNRMMKMLKKMNGTESARNPMAAAKKSTTVMSGRRRSKIRKPAL